MARRRMHGAVKQKGQAFTGNEVMAVHQALRKLYHRTIHHIVSPNFPRPPLPDVWRSLIHDDTWQHMAQAQAIMILPRNTWQYFTFEDKLELAILDLPPGVVSIGVQSKRLLPALAKSTRTEVVIPDAYFKFAEAALVARNKWIAVWDAFSELNTSTTRLTAGYHWPCASALMMVGGCPAPDLANCTRPGAIAGELAVKLRDTNAFVMQYSMLPPIDNVERATYEGDAETGLAARLSFNTHHSVFGDELWPVED